MLAFEHTAGKRSAFASFKKKKVMLGINLKSDSISVPVVGAIN